MFTSLRPTLAACLLALAGSSHAVALVADGQWNTFDVDELSAPSGGLEWIDIFNGGQALSFDFSIPSGFQGTLTVVDGGFAGDRFLVTNANQVLGSTSVPVASYPDSVGLDFDAAQTDSRYSQGSWVLGAGDHSISGLMILSLAIDGVPLNATVGAVRLEISPVPEPASLATLLAGLGLLTIALRRRGL